jgi:hypothetical protein
MIVAERGANDIAIFGSTTSTIAAPGAEALTVGQVTPLAPSVTVTNGIGGPTNLLFNDFALYVPNATGNTVAEFVPPLTSASTPSVFSSEMNEPSAITFLFIPQR